MRGKALICLLILCLFVGVVSADTLIVYTSGTSDGYIIRQASTGTTNWYDLRDGGGTAVDTTNAHDQAKVLAYGSGSKWKQIDRAYFEFNTSALGSSASISSATVGIYGHITTSTGVGTFTVGITGFSPATDGTAVAADYQTFGSTRYSDTNIANGSWLTSAYNNFTFNSEGLSAIDKTGWTNIMLRTNWDIDNDTTGLTYSGSAYSQVVTQSDEHGATGDPFIQIEYTTGPEPDITPPASITGLGNTTTCNSINWTWTDSISDDADVVQIWQNNTFLHNVSANQTYDLWEDLEELTEYEFASHTCDLSFNCNTTWVNLSSTTLTCATPTPTPTPTPAPDDAGFDGYAHFNFTAWNTSPMDDWNWSVNELFVGNGTETFLNTWLLWGQIHNITLTVSNATDNRTITQFYNLHNVTPTVTATPTPWQPEIMPDTEFNVAPESIFSYWWVAALVFVTWVLLFRR